MKAIIKVEMETSWEKLKHYAYLRSGSIIPVTLKNRERHEMEDKLFMLSATQVFGKNGEREKQDVGDSQLDIFKRPRNRVKEWNGDTWYWWLRSAYNTNNFSMVNNNGNENNNNANNSNGLVLGFNVVEPSLVKVRKEIRTT